MALESKTAPMSANMSDVCSKRNASGRRIQFNEWLATHDEPTTQTAISVLIAGDTPSKACETADPVRTLTRLPEPILSVYASARPNSEPTGKPSNDRSDAIA